MKTLVLSAILFTSAIISSYAAEQEVAVFNNVVVPPPSGYSTFEPELFPELAEFYTTLEKKTPSNHVMGRFVEIADDRIIKESWVIVQQQFHTLSLEEFNKGKSSFAPSPSISEAQLLGFSQVKSDALSSVSKDQASSTFQYEVLPVHFTSKNSIHFTLIEKQETPALSQSGTQQTFSAISCAAIWIKGHVFFIYCSETTDSKFELFQIVDSSRRSIEKWGKEIFVRNMISPQNSFEEELEQQNRAFKKRPKRDTPNFFNWTVPDYVLKALGGALVGGLFGLYSALKKKK